MPVRLTRHNVDRYVPNYPHTYRRGEPSDTQILRILAEAEKASPRGVLAVVLAARLGMAAPRLRERIAALVDDEDAFRRRRTSAAPWRYTHNPDSPLLTRRRTQ